MTLRLGRSIPLFLIFHAVLLAAMPAKAFTPAHKTKAAPSTAHAKTTRSSHAGKSQGQAPSRSLSGSPAKGKHLAKSHTVHAPTSPFLRENAATRIESSLNDPSASPLLYPSALRPFFQALAAEQTERTTSVDPQSPSRTVRILQFGDSHTAADLFTGELRARFQASFGDGGLGFQYPGHPFAGYHLAGSLRSETSGWFTEGNRFTELGSGDLGLGGISISTSQPDQSISLETTCETAQLHFLRQPGGGRLQFTDNGTPISIIATATGSDDGVNSGSPAGSFSYACTAGTHALQFTTLDHAPVKLFGLVTERPGTTYECLGINGAVAPLILRWNQTLFAEYLRQREPDLIVLAYGTNEAGGSFDRLAAYPDEFDQVLDTLHRKAPQAAILVLGPYDRLVASTTGTRRHRRTTWHTLAGVDRVIAMQREACRTHNCAFWDARRRMGGSGAMQQWVSAGWAQSDHTHLTGTGYHALADALYADLIRAYNQRQSGQTTSPSTNQQ